jgi:D-aspartate ligase
MTLDFKGTRVLILEGYARQSLPIIRSLKELGCHVTVLCSSRLDVAYASRLPDKKILGICSSQRYSDTVDCIRSLIATNDYDLVIPLVDFSAEILARYKDEFQKYVRVASNDIDSFALANDKSEVMQICMANDIPCPKTLAHATSIRDIISSKLIYPIVIKPRRSCGAQGFLYFNSEDELVEYGNKYKIDLAQSVVQEYIPQGDVNLSCNFFIDANREIKSSFIYASLRWFPLRGGTGTFNILVERPDVYDTCSRLMKLFRLTGCVGIDLIHDPRDGVAKVLEINPRIMACAKIGFDAGINLARQILELAFDHPVSKMTVQNKNIRIRMSQTDILWFLKSPMRFRVRPSFFDNRYVKDQLFSWDDPLPWFAYTLRGLLQLKEELKKRGT